jgi:hypothetical protein
MALTLAESLYEEYVFAIPADARIQKKTAPVSNIFFPGVSLGYADGPAYQKLPVILL